jgi:hypothetical protein
MEQMNTQQVTSFAPLFAVAILAAPASAATQRPCIDGASGYEYGVSVNACAPWVDRQIAQLKVLQREWTKFDADPLQVKTISQLRALLANAHRSNGVVGHLVPGADGSLQAEWHLKNESIGLLVEDDGTYSSWVRFHGTNRQAEKFGGEALPFFQALANQYRLNV